MGRSSFRVPGRLWLRILGDTSLAVAAAHRLVLKPSGPVRLLDVYQAPGCGLNRFLVCAFPATPSLLLRTAVFVCCSPLRGRSGWPRRGEQHTDTDVLSSRDGVAGKAQTRKRFRPQPGA